MAKPRLRVLAPDVSGNPVPAFGLAELRHGLREAGFAVADGPADFDIRLAGAAPAGDTGQPGPPESYAIERGAAGLTLRASDDVGLMYACLDLAEQIRMGAEPAAVEPRVAAPELAVRGVCRFLHNAEAEREWLYDPAYWQAYADELARCRFNRFNLIYGHQTAYLIPVYTHLLDDLDEAYPTIRAAGITSEERAANLRALQSASAAMASRGIRFFLGIWQSRPWTVAGGEREDQPTRVAGTEDVRLLARYTRDGFVRLIERCPDIHGVQLRMNAESGVSDQRFFVESFVPALRDLAARGRRLQVELRNWALQPATLEAFLRAGLDVIVSTKYFAEHQALPYQPPVMRGSYSYDTLPASDRPVPLLWHLWNLGSHRLFVWGDPDYARRFARSCHLGNGIGFEVTPPGSQKGFSQWGQVTPGDWQARPDLPKRRDFEQYWLFYMAFGRLGYDSSTWDPPFLHQLARRTSAEAAPILLAAYRAASRIVSYLITMRMDDPNMYVWPELDCGGPIDHNSVARPGDPTLFASAREHARDRVAGRATARRSPFDAAWDLERYASGVEEALAQLQLEDIPSVAESLEFRTIEPDFQALRALARYHASKCRATGNLALFYATGERAYLDDAERAARAAMHRWEELCARTERYHHRLHFGPSGGHWRDNRSRVEYDLRRIWRVRELFERFGLFTFGFDFGTPFQERVPSARADPRFDTGLEPEPRFIGVDLATAYAPEQGYGWLETEGLCGVGPTRLPRSVIWGVHYITPGWRADPATPPAMPLDGLTRRYLSAHVPRTFRVDLANGEYEVTLCAPPRLDLATPVRIDDGSGRADLAIPMTVGGAVGEMARTTVHVRAGRLLFIIGGGEEWALAAIVIRPVGPLIAHLPPPGSRGDQDLVLTATATGPVPIRQATIEYLANDEWREARMDGDGVAFRATVPAGHLSGDALEYRLVVEDESGRQAGSGPFRIPILREFRPLAVAAATIPKAWEPDVPLPLALAVQNGDFVREIRVHYREADQSRDFLAAFVPGPISDTVELALDTSVLDRRYPLLVYFEVIDAFGRGFFYPDPFEHARYFVLQPSPVAA